MRPRASAVAIALSALAAAACGQGKGERIDPFTLAEPIPRAELPDAGPQESESELLAREHQPVADPVFDLSEELAFACDGTPPGRVLQRLNRFEYDNTVRDLLGDDSKPASAFPKDDFGDSFDNNADALSVSPLLTEAYSVAAEELAVRAMDPDSSFVSEYVSCTARDEGTANCARQILTPFLMNAFRRPVFDREVDPYVDLVELAIAEGGSFEEGLQTAVEATLLSVQFLFRVELDPDDASFHTLTQHELANRLSYFLWSSMPDAELMAAANEGRLSSEAQLLEQVDRMLDDSKASALLSAFAGRWLETADVSASNEPALELFPEYTPKLEAAMEKETRLFMRDVLSGELPFSELLTADYSYMNAALAEHYGIEGDFTEDDFERVSLDGTERTGLLTHGSVLTLTAAPTRTSLVRRGVYVLTNLLCSAPPPPPPDVQGDLDSDSDEIDDSLPLGERAKQHSDDPTCAGCHVLIDPIGLGLENFDAIGRYRSEELGQAIDASGLLIVEGEQVEFEGAKELASLLADDQRLTECAVRKLYTYALGRTPVASSADQCRMDWLLESFQTSGYDFRELIRTVVLTDSFRGRGGDLASPSDEEQE